ncbi:adhesion G protein-coupled receptor G3-like [Scleropages formosus]|uniref:Adhesion G protein-coupled receptor G3-like n=1 Tax=Scleropages formosus TaxID=113540 RepID=A0A8C9RYH8_SCLFO|nr:adhesion G protein-coupled receptor G3-like [Scleropages formosus]
MEQCLYLFLLLCLITNSTEQPMPCHTIMDSCLSDQMLPWTRCFEHSVMMCVHRGRMPMQREGQILEASIEDISMKNEVKRNTSTGHLIHIPAEVLERAMKRSRMERSIRLVVSVFHASLFKAQKHTGNELLGNSVLGVKVGIQDFHNLSKPVTLTFRHYSKEENGSCVFWKDGDSRQDTGGRWSTQGCQTIRMNKTFICSCDHLSFFAVLVNPGGMGTISDSHVLSLSYITYIGCGLSVFFTSIALLFRMCMRLSRKKARDEHSMAVHLQLMAALLLLHLLFLLSSWQAERPLAVRGGGLCLALGLLLHWALLATFTWTALEAFHLYLLLVRVFNIYITKYLLKLCVVGWGVPSVVVAACALIRPYGLYSFQAGNKTDSSAGTSTYTSTNTSICWITSGAVQYITVSAYLGIVFLFSAAMLGVVLVKVQKIGSKDVQTQQMKKISQKCVTLLGLSCVLGIPWGLAFLTYGPLSLAGVYIFTIVNSLQGVFLFLWFCSLTWKLRAADGSIVTYQSTPKTENGSAT